MVPCRSKGRALTRAKQLLKESDTELSALSNQAAALNQECDRIQARIDELGVSQLSSADSGRYFYLVNAETNLHLADSC